jgi:hypothetical protein
LLLLLNHQITADGSLLLLILFVGWTITISSDPSAVVWSSFAWGVEK